jgi:type IV pilus assembly protein PilM
MGQLDDLVQGLLGTSNIVGLDIGASSVKVCELIKGNKGQYRLKSFGIAPLPEDAMIEGEIHNKDSIIGAIKQALKSSGVKSKKTCIGLTGNNCVIKKMTAPKGKDDEVIDFVNWEAEQFIVFGAENAEIGVYILDYQDDPEKVDVIMAAAKIEYVEEVIEVIEESGCNAGIVDLQMLSLINVFEHSYIDELKEYRKGSLIVDFGAQSTKVVVYRNGAPILAKSLPLGGNEINENIQKEIGVTYEEAEDLKTTTDDSGNYPEEILDIIKNHVKTIVSEIKDTIQFYTSTTSQEKVHYCFITGGSIQLPGLIEELTVELNLTIEILDPFRRISIGMSRMSEDLQDKLAYIGATPLGLAIRKFDKNK